MFKKIFFIFLLSINILHADLLFKKLKNIIGNKQFQIHNNLLQNIFKNRKDFYITNYLLNYVVILKNLKDNGLLKLKFQKPTNVTITFHSNNDPIKSLKILNEVLAGMGYSFYFTKEIFFNKKTNQLTWTINFKTESMIDSYLLVKDLKIRHCKVRNILKIKNNNWRYDIDVNFSTILEAIAIDKHEKVTLSKPLKPYLLEVSQAKILAIMSKRLNHWFPYIVFYDKHLNILKSIKRNGVYREYKSNVPRGTRYIKIDDLYTLLNIKRGLSVIVK
jgi:hypothetical protein